MKTVGIRELKSRLSHYVREVGAGEVFVVTDRGEPVAELRPAGGVHDASSADDRLRALAPHGLRLGTAHDPGVYGASPVRLPDGTAQALLDEDRGER